VRLNFDNMLEIYKSGYTRIPVYDTQPQAIIGILYTKDLILVDPGARPAAITCDRLGLGPPRRALLIYMPLPWRCRAAPWRARRPGVRGALP